MQLEPARQRQPDPWPFDPVPKSAADHDLLKGSRVEDSGSADRCIPDADELVARLRARRSASGVAAAYAAIHGHPADPRSERGTRRWALTRTTAVVAGVAVILLGVGVAALSMHEDGVKPLALVNHNTQPAGVGSVRESKPASSHESAPDPSPRSTANPTSGGGLLVHVVGQVAKPGVVTLPDDARVADAVQAAGGATRHADLSAVNLARTVMDGEQVYVPKPGEAVAMKRPRPEGPQTRKAPIDINTADAQALDQLPGIGPTIAHAIIEWREINGPFASVDELENVTGIGPATLAEIRDAVQVGP